jgi:Arginase family
MIDPAPRTFYGVPSLSDPDRLDAQVAFLGVPYDGGTPEPGVPTGQRAGPAAAREATHAQFYYPASTVAGDGQGADGWYDVEADRDRLVGVTMVDLGDVLIQGSATEANYERITGAARAIAERGALMVAIGGDHSISYPLGRGMEPCGRFDVVHVDAHTDFLDELDGSRLTGASQLRRLVDCRSWARSPPLGFVTSTGPRSTGCGRSGALGDHARRARARRRGGRGHGGAGGRPTVRLDRPGRARCLGRARALAAGARGARLPRAARDPRRRRPTRARDRLRRRRAESPPETHPAPPRGWPRGSSRTSSARSSSDGVNRRATRRAGTCR